MQSILINTHRLKLKVRPKMVWVHKKDEWREARREEKAEYAARLRQTVDYREPTACPIEECTCIAQNTSHITRTIRVVIFEYGITTLGIVITHKPLTLACTNPTYQRPRTLMWPYLPLNLATGRARTYGDIYKQFSESAVPGRGRMPAPEFSILNITT